MLLGCAKEQYFGGYRSWRRKCYHCSPSTMRHYFEVNHDLRAMLRDAAELPCRDVESVESLVSAGEWELALDTLCTQMDTYGIVPSEAGLEKLLSLGEELGVDVRGLLGLFR